MIEKFEYKGLWFLPSNPQRKVHGILKYDYEKNINVLELIGSFYDYSNHDGEDIILGVTTEGDEITLAECQFKSSSGIPRDESDKSPISIEDRLPTLNFIITYILKGQHIITKDDLQFQKIYVEIFNFDEWVGISGLETNNDYANSIKTIYYKTPDPINIKINDDFDMKIQFNSNHPMRFRFNNELKLSQRTIFSFHAKKYTTIHEFTYLLRKFNNFLSTSLQKPVRIQSMELYSDKFIETIGANDKIEKAIDGYQIINPELKFEEKKQDWEMFFTYNDIKNDFETIIQKWFANYEKFEEPFNLVLSQYYISEYFLEGLFINVAQAAESFHRRLELVDDTPKIEQDKTFNDRRNIILENTPEELKNWVKSQITKPKHFYVTRLKYLLKEFSNSELDKMIGDHSKFVKDVAISRNYYTHYNRDQEKGAAHGVDLIFLYEKLRLLLLCSFLIESGFKKPLLEKLIKEKSYNVFRYLRN